jgi:hypothetical protein
VVSTSLICAIQQGTKSAHCTDSARLVRCIQRPLGVSPGGFFYVSGMPKVPDKSKY